MPMKLLLPCFKVRSYAAQKMDTIYLNCFSQGLKDISNGGESKFAVFSAT